MLTLSRNDLALITQALQLQYWTRLNSSTDMKISLPGLVMTEELRNKISAEITAIDKARAAAQTAADNNITPITGKKKKGPNAKA